jgi:sirohydrochlorin ferrochelatase
MSTGLLVFRRDLPGGRFVMISVETAPDTGEVVGRLRFERRSDPARQRAGEAPVIAEARGGDHATVLARLRSMADSDESLHEAVERWNTARRAMS